MYSETPSVPILSILYVFSPHLAICYNLFFYLSLLFVCLYFHPTKTTDDDEMVMNMSMEKKKRIKTKNPGGTVQVVDQF